MRDRRRRYHANFPNSLLDNRRSLYRLAAHVLHLRFGAFGDFCLQNGVSPWRGGVRAISPRGNAKPELWCDMKMPNIAKLLEDQLKDIYNAETSL